MPATSRHPEHRQPLLLLGEQREKPRLQQALERWKISGPVGLIAAGWEEDEFEDEWIRSALQNQVVNSQLYELADRMFAEDPEVLVLLRSRQDRLRELREINQVQVDRMCRVIRELMRRTTQSPAVQEALELTARQIREADEQHLQRVNSVLQEFDQRIAPLNRPAVLTYRERVLERLQGCEALLLAGGHVGVLLNRLELSRLLTFLPLPVIAWSGGAMALGERVYFFNQMIPHATGEMELSRRGKGLYTNLQLFPRADERLKVNDRIEMALLAQRVAEPCLLLDSASELEWDGERLTNCAGVRILQEDGVVVEWKP
jgi:hypothetical protein